jgi:diguanylate cyclase (GGDEF)-like protein/PAS domain S-box-containing protein
MSFNRKLQLAFGSATFALLIVGVIAYRGMLLSRKSDHWVRHTHEVLENLQDLLVSDWAMDASCRGFLTTGKNSYLDSYTSQLASTRLTESTLASLTSDNPRQQYRLLAIKSLIDQKVRVTDALIASRQAGSSRPGVVDFESPGTARRARQLQEEISEARREELTLLQGRDTDAMRHLTQTEYLLIFGVALGLLITAAAGWSAQRDNASRELAEASLRVTEKTTRSLLDGVTDYALIMLDPVGNIMRWNTGAELITGCSAERAVGRNVSSFFSEADIRLGRLEELLRLAARLGRYEDQGIRIREDGSRYETSSTYTALHDPAGELTGFSVVARDLNKEQESAARYRGLLEAAPDAMIVVDQSGHILILNVQTERQFGYSRDELIGQPVKRIIPHGFDERLIADASRTAAEALAQQIDTGIELIGLRRNGSEFPLEIMLSPLENANGILVTAAIRNITLRKRAEQVLVKMSLQMAYAAEHDFLTDLPNRLLLKDRVGQAIVSAAQHSHNIALLFLDMDGFKQVNDSLGHAIGDKLLQSISKRLLDSVRASDTVSRQGGDEFVVLLSDVDHPIATYQVVNALLAVVAKTHAIDQHELHLTASIGVSVYPDDGLDAETLIQNADTAMYQAKAKGRQSFQFFTSEMNVRAVERQSIEEAMRRALDRDEFAVHYQPKVDLRTGKITGAEALVRWTHPVRGLISPALLIPVAEECGIIVPLGRWVLQQACRQASAWADAGYSQTAVAVNVSAIEFRQENFLQGIFAILEEAQLPPNMLEIEVTESVLIQNGDATESILRTLRQSGVRIAIDDFGTGYSSLSYLERFPVDALKIDQSFIRQIADPPQKNKIVSAVIGIGKSLNLTIIAEGVETLAQLEFLRNHHCDKAQGYLFSKPIPAEDFARLLQSGVPSFLPEPSILRPVA